jgi:hypothetical protein
MWYSTSDTDNHAIANKVVLEVLHNVFLLDLWDASTISSDWLSDHMITEGSVVDAVQDDLLGVSSVSHFVQDLLSDLFNMVLVEGRLGKNVPDNLENLRCCVGKEANIDGSQLTPGLNG